MIQQQGVCSSSLVLHKSLNLLVSFAVLWQKLQSLLCVPMSGFSIDNTDRSNAAGLLLKPQLLTRMSAGLDCSGHDQDHCQLPAYRVQCIRLS